MKISELVQKYGPAVTAAIPPEGLLGNGNVFFVDSGATNALDAADGEHGNSWDQPFALIDYAVGRCTANNGDVILVAQGHTETVSAAGDITLDVAGITIVGMGYGSVRPTITLDTITSASINVTAANVTLANCIITANFADIVTVFLLSTAYSQNFHLLNCSIEATATDMNFTYVMDIDAGANYSDGLTVEDCVWISPDTATVSLIKVDGNIDRVVIKNNYLSLGVNNNEPALFDVSAVKAVTNVLIEGNRIVRLNTDTSTGALLLKGGTVANSNGIICNNFIQCADAAAILLIPASSGLGCFNNYVSGVVGASGFLLPAADSDA